MSEFLQGWRDATEATLRRSPAAKDGRMVDGARTEDVIAMALIELIDAVRENTTAIRESEHEVIVNVPAPVVTVVPPGGQK